MAAHSILKVNSYENASEHIQYQLGVTVGLWSSGNCFQRPGEEDRHIVCALTSSVSGGWYIDNYWKNTHLIFLRKKIELIGQTPYSLSHLSEANDISSYSTSKHHDNPLIRII